MVPSYIIIPARLASTRLPHKLLKRETGQPLIQHTYESAARARKPSGVVVAADHPDIAAAVTQFGGQVRMTNPQAASGTDRIAEVAEHLPDFEILVNVQGDEPEIAGADIDLAIELLEKNPQSVMSTLACPLRDEQRLRDPACVKLVMDPQQRALYFSRSPIPFPRDQPLAEALQADPPLFWQHIGLYAYRRDFLLQLRRLPRSPLELCENLEQLRVLSNGYVIQVGIVASAAAGIDTPADYQAFVERHRRQAAA